MFGLVFASGLAGYLVSRTGLYKPWLIAGGVVLLVGMLLLASVKPSTPLAGVAWRLFIVGLGLGPAQSLFGLAVQNAVRPRVMGIATSGSQFFRQIGATVGVALAGALLTHDFNAEFARRAPTAHQAIDVAQLQARALAEAEHPGTPAGAPMPPALVEATQASVSIAVVDIFRAGLGVAALGLALVLLIPALPMRSRAERLAAAAEAEAAAGPA